MMIYTYENPLLVVILYLSIEIDIFSMECPKYVLSLKMKSEFLDNNISLGRSQPYGIVHSKSTLTLDIMCNNVL